MTIFHSRYKLCDGQPAQETGDEAQAIPSLKRFTVFNVAHCENLPDDLAVVPPAPEPGLVRASRR